MGFSGPPGKAKRTWAPIERTQVLSQGGGLAPEYSLVSVRNSVRVAQVSSQGIGKSVNCLGVQTSVTGPPDSNRGSVYATDGSVSQTKSETTPILLYKT